VYNRKQEIAVVEVKNKQEVKDTQKMRNLEEEENGE